MQIAYTLSPGRGDTDIVLLRVAEAMIAMGHKPRGTVQINSETCNGGPCDMDVRVLPDGPVLRISQSLGGHAKGCRLDPGALEEAAGRVAASLGGETDCLIVNKFGKHEAEGRGFRDVIAMALSEEIPVLVGLNALNAKAFFEFSGGLAEQVEPDASKLLDWLMQRLRNTDLARSYVTS
jgi:hypothetical protein